MPLHHRLAAALLGCAIPLTAQALAPTTATESPAQAAWLRYHDTLADQRARLLAADVAADPQIRAQGLYFLQSSEVAAFNQYVAARPLYPALYVQSFFMPLELSWGMPNPDFVNHNGFIDGARTYRIYGKRNGNRWATLQVMKGFWGDDIQGNLANIDFDDLPAKPDGSFEIFLGPNPPADPRGQTWIKLDPSLHNNMAVLRETAYDWARETPLDVHIEALDRPADAAVYDDEATLAARIDRARKWSIANFDFAMRAALPPAGSPPREVNRFYDTVGGRQQGGNPLGTWITMRYNLAPDDALLIEMPVIPARYWGFQLGTVWGQTTDYSYHQSSLNGTQLRVDRDGKVRLILSLQDPGVPNWLDPAGIPIGTALLRFYKSEGSVIPDVIRIKLSEVRGHLPPDTPRVTAADRKTALAARRIASLRRYGQ